MLPSPVPNASEPGTTSTYDGLDRVLTSKDPLSNTTTTSYSSECGLDSGDSACYTYTTTVDANSHQSRTFTDSLGRTRSQDTYTGTGTQQNPYVAYAVTTDKYDYNGNVISEQEPDKSHTNTATFDAAGRKTASTDPNAGSFTYTYDADGNLTESVDARGSSGTIYAGYDGLNRQLWRNTTNSATGAYVTYTYDSTSGGNDGVGRVTGKTFNAGSSFGVGSYSYTYNARGEKTASTTVLDGTSYPFGESYNDAGQPTSFTYSDSSTLTYNYDTNGWLNSAVSGSTNLYTALSYSDAGGATGLPNAASLSSAAISFSAQYDNDLRPTLTKLSVSGTTKYQSQTTYDAVGNVVAIATTLQAGTDNQAFCYDEQNRLTWAGAKGTPSCGGSLTEGTLTSAAYTTKF